MQNASCKFVGSTGSSTGQNPFLAGKGQQSTRLGQKKFGKAKEEKRSPSTNRGKSDATDATEAIEAATPTQGTDIKVAEEHDELMELEQKADADKKRHKAAIDGNEAADGIKKQEAEEINVDFEHLLEKERQKRRDVEDTVDELKSEIGFQRETLARTSFTLGKVVTANLQVAERADAVTIYVVKKKQEKARQFFEAYKSLQQLVTKEQSMVAVSNNGPMLHITITGPEQVRDSMTAIKEWQRRSGIEAAVFKGKSVVTQMLELPIRAAYNTMLSVMGLDSNAAREAGLNTCWLDYEKKWSITHADKAIIRGKCNVADLESEVHINMEDFDEAAAAEVISKMKNFAAADRFGPLFELSFSRLEKFGLEQYGRQPRPGGKGGGGKGSGKY